LRSGIELFAKNKFDSYELHQYGLISLLNSNQVDEKNIMKMLNISEPLTQQYGAMLGKKRDESYPQILKHALSSDNFDIQEFAQLVLDVN